MGDIKKVRFVNYTKEGRHEILTGIVISEEGQTLQAKVGNRIYTPRDRDVMEIKEIPDNNKYPDDDDER